MASSQLNGQVGTSHLDCQPQVPHMENHDENNLSILGSVCGGQIGNLCIIGQLGLWLWEDSSRIIWL